MFVEKKLVITLAISASMFLLSLFLLKEKSVKSLHLPLPKYMDDCNYSFDTHAQIGPHWSLVWSSPGRAVSLLHGNPWGRTQNKQTCERDMGPASGERRAETTRILVKL